MLLIVGLVGLVFVLEWLSHILNMRKRVVQLLGLVLHLKANLGGWQSFSSRIVAFFKALVLLGSVLVER